MKVVIDTNVVLSAIGKLSPNRKIFDAILNGNLDLSISNEIFFEYKEILSRKTNSEISHNFAFLITMLSNVYFTEIYYKWTLIDEDPDDNKFIDCYIASNSDYLITNDKHFDVMIGIEFPSINVISSDEFINKFLT